MDSVELVALAERAALPEGAVDLAQLERQVPDLADVLSSKRLPFWDRALAARALGTIVHAHPSLLPSLERHRQAVLDGLLELSEVCQQAPFPTADCRKVHVVCCLVISMVMQSSQSSQPPKSAVSPDSGMLHLSAAPVDEGTRELFLLCHHDITALGGYAAARRTMAPPQQRKPAPRQAWGSIGGGADPLDEAAVASLAAATAAMAGSGAPTRPLAPASEAGSAVSTAASSAASMRRPRWGHPRAEGGGADSDAVNKDGGSRGGGDDDDDDAVDKLPLIATRTAIGGASASDLAPKRVRHAPTHAVLFGSEGASSLGLDAEGNPIPLFELPSPRALGYNVSRMWFPTERPKTADPAAAHTAKPGASVELVGGARSPVQRGWGEVGGVRGSMHVNLPTKMLSIAKQQVLPPQHYLRMLQDGSLPASVPDEPQRTVHAHALHKPPPVQAARGGGADKATVAAALIARAPAAEEVEDDDGGMNAESYAQQELRQLLSKSVVSNPAQTTAEVAKLAAAEHGVLMGALQQQITTLNASERKIGRSIERMIEADWEKLPMRFLLQVPGGVEYYCQRVRKALGLWIAQFERAQCVRVFRQLQALVEVHRFKQRTVVYRRQAAVKLMRAFLHKLVLATRRRALHTWFHHVRWLIWVVRDAAALVVQTNVRRRHGLWALLALHDAGSIGGPLRDVYLAPPRMGLPFCLPARLRAERRPPWQAAIYIQAPYRGRKWRRWFAQQKHAAIVIQTGARMWAKRDWYREYRLAAIVLQARIRMVPVYRNYQPLAPAARVLQRNWRAHEGRAFFRVILLAQRQHAEQKLNTPIVCIQRFWRRNRWQRIEARQDVRLRNAKRRNEVAVFKMQKAWYTRPSEPEGLGMFLQLGIMREVDAEVRLRNRKVDMKFRLAKVLILQRFVRKSLGHGFGAAALAVQTAWRRFRAAGAISKSRMYWIARRRLRWWARGCVLRRQKAASRIQFAWWKSVSRRFLQHLMHVRQMRQLAWELQEKARKAAAATLIQALVKGSWTRFWLKRTGSTVQIQRIWQGYAGRRRWKREWLDVRQTCATGYTATSLRLGVLTELNRQARLATRSARKIQRSVRGWLHRHRLSCMWIQEEAELKMAIRLQRMWKAHGRSRLARMMVNVQRRRLNNPYTNIELVAGIIRSVLQDAVVYYDCNDAEAGMGLPTWLRRLGCDRHFDALKENKVTTVEELRLASDEELKKIIVHDDEALELVRVMRQGRNATSAVREGFALLPDMTAVQTIFLKAYPGYGSRAKAFAHACEEAAATLTPLMLQRFFAQHDLPGGAKTHIGSLFSYAHQVSEAQHDKLRVARCIDLYMYGLELIVDRFESSSFPDGLVSDTVKKLMMEMRSTESKDSAGAWRLRELLDWLKDVDYSCILIERNWRGRSGRQVCRTYKQSRMLKEMEEAYQHERKLDRVRITWDLERKREAENIARWEEEQRVAAIIAELEWSLQFNWLEEWDEETEANVYVNTKTHRRSSTRPIYNFAHDLSIREVQRIVRGFVGRRRAKEQERLKIRRQAETKLLVDWDLKRPERRRFVSVRIKLKLEQQPKEALEAACGKAMDAYNVALTADPAEKMRQAAKLPPRSRPLDYNGRCLLDLVTAVDQHERAMSLVRTAIVKLEYTKVQMPYGWDAVPDPHTGEVYFYNSVSGETAWEEPEFTFAEANSAGLIQRQWRALLGRRRFKEVLDACTLEDVARLAVREGKRTTWVGFGLEGMRVQMWLARMGMLDLLEVLLPPQHGRHKKPQMTLAQLLDLDDKALLEMGMKKPDQRHRILAFPRYAAVPACPAAPPLSSKSAAPLTPLPHLVACDVSAVCSFAAQPFPMEPTCEGWPSQFSFIRDVAKLKKMVLLGVNKQELRAGHITDAILESETPVTTEQVEAHLRRHKGRPREAQDMVKEQVCDQPTMPNPEEEAAAFQIFKRASDRLLVLAGNKNLNALHSILQDTISMADGEVARENTLRAMQPLLCLGAWEPPLFPEAQAEAAVQHDTDAQAVSEPVPLPNFYGALLLRTQVIEVVLRWARSAIVVQAGQRMHALRMWYLEVRNLRHSSATRLQLAWLSCNARAAASFCRLQRKSEWEQLWSVDQARMYWVHNPSKGAIWHAPRDPWGSDVRACKYRVPPLCAAQLADRFSVAVLLRWLSLSTPLLSQVPFRPQVRDRYSGRLISAWPDLDETAADDEEEDDELCCHCHKEEATRECHQCIVHGKRQKYCFGCFHMVHQRELEMRGHSSSIMDAAWRDKIVRCIECKEQASTRCAECDDNYCDNCFERIHRKGNKRLHARAPLGSEGATAAEQGTDADGEGAKALRPPVCVECGKPADRECEQCGDLYCSVTWMGNAGCFAKYHGKGNRRHHTFQPWSEQQPEVESPKGGGTRRPKHGKKHGKHSNSKSKHKLAAGESEPE